MAKMDCWSLLRMRSPNIYNGPLKQCALAHINCYVLEKDTFCGGSSCHCHDQSGLNGLADHPDGHIGPVEPSALDHPSCDHPWSASHPQHHGDRKIWQRMKSNIHNSEVMNTHSNKCQIKWAVIWAFQTMKQVKKSKVQLVWAWGTTLTEQKRTHGSPERIDPWVCKRHRHLRTFQRFFVGRRTLCDRSSCRLLGTSFPQCVVVHVRSYCSSNSRLAQG